MSAVVLDTHATVWALIDRNRLSTAAQAAIAGASIEGSAVFVPAITVVEITYLIEKGRLPARVRNELLAALDNPRSSLRLAPLDLDVAARVEQIDRSEIADMPDRIIAATAVHLGLPLVSRDGKIRASVVNTIW